MLLYFQTIDSVAYNALNYQNQLVAKVYHDNYLEVNSQLLHVLSRLLYRYFPNFTGDEGQFERITSLL